MRQVYYFLLGVYEFGRRCSSPHDNLSELNAYVKGLEFAHFITLGYFRK